MRSYRRTVWLVLLIWVGVGGGRVFGGPDGPEEKTPPKASEAAWKLDFISRPGTEAEFTEKLREALQVRLKTLMWWHRSPSIAVAVLEDGKIVMADAMGYANLESWAPADGETVYACASLTKPFIATMLLALLEEGAEHRPFVDFLDDADLPHGSDREKLKGVTVADLLAHRTRIRPTGKAQGWGFWESLYDPAFHVSYASLMEAFSIHPRARSEYNNYNYVLAGRILQRYDQRLRKGDPQQLSSLDDLLEKYLVSPGRLSLTSTSFSPTWAMLHRMAVPYLIGAAGDPEPLEPKRCTIPSAAGLHSTVLDLAQFLRFHLSELRAGTPETNRLRRAATVMQESLRGRDSNEMGRHGLGWRVRPDAPTLVFQHNGIRNGYSAFLAGEPGGRRGVVLLASSRGNELCTSGNLVGRGVHHKLWGAREGHLGNDLRDTALQLLRDMGRGDRPTRQTQVPESKRPAPHERQTAAGEETDVARHALRLDEQVWVEERTRGDLLPKLVGPGPDAKAKVRAPTGEDVEALMAVLFGGEESRLLYFVIPALDRTLLLRVEPEADQPMGSLSLTLVHSGGSNALEWPEDMSLRLTLGYTATLPAAQVGDRWYILQGEEASTLRVACRIVGQRLIGSLGYRSYERDTSHNFLAARTPPSDVTLPNGVYVETTRPVAACPPHGPEDVAAHPPLRVEIRDGRIEAVRFDEGVDWRRQERDSPHWQERGTAHGGRRLICTVNQVPYRLRVWSPVEFTEGSAPPECLVCLVGSGRCCRSLRVMRKKP